MFDFFGMDEWRSAPDDPTAAFIYLVGLAGKRLTERISNYDDNEWDSVNEARYAYMNVLSGLASHYGIEAIASLGVPIWANYSDASYKQFKADLDHCMVRLVGSQIRAEHDDSIALLPTTKEKLRTHLHHLKACIDKAELGDARRKALLEKLAAFEAELDGGRLSFASIAKFAIQVSLAGLAISDSQTFHRLLDGFLTTVGEVHAIEMEQRQIPLPAVMRAILPPRPPQPEPKPKTGGPRETFDLDDEIPF